MAEEKQKSIGALWSKTSGRGDYFTGQIELADGSKLKIVVFRNGYKTEDKHPDWRIYESKPKEAGNWPSHEDLDSNAPVDSGEMPF